MDKIWDRKSKSEVIRRCDGDEKTEWPQQNIWMVKKYLSEFDTTFLKAKFKCLSCTYISKRNTHQINIDNHNS